MTWLVADAELFKRVEVGEELEVHMLGVEKEVEMKEAFLVGSSTFYVLSLIHISEPTRRA